MAISRHSEGFILRMGFNSEFRHPSTWYFKLMIVTMGLLLFVVMGVTAISGYLVYRMMSPAQSHSGIKLENFPGRPEALAYDVPGETARNGWFFPGLKTAPTIILCPAYQSSREELLTLASALQDHQYNVLLIDFSAQGSNGGHSALGFKEVAELQAAINAVAHRGDVDASRFGIWGVDIGGYVALAAAARDPRVRALAIESPYNRPQEMVELLVTRSGLAGIPMITRMSRWIFDLANYRYRNVAPLERDLDKLAGVPQLYLESGEERVLSNTTTQIFRTSPPPHELVMLARGNYAGMMDQEKRTYENRIVSFFLMNLSAAGNSPGRK